MLDSVMAQHSKSELSSLECAIGGQITGADPGWLFQLASLVVMKHEKTLEMQELPEHLHCKLIVSCSQFQVGWEASGN